MRLDLFDLQLFLNIVDSGSLTRGAERSAISLQAASERIKKLEQQFTVQLFIRHSSGVSLTLAGQAFAEQATLMIQQGRHLQHSMLPFSRNLSCEVALWCNSSAQSEYLPQLLPQYLVENPQVRIDHQLQTLEFSDDPLVLICPLKHELSHFKELVLADTLTQPFVGLMQHHSLQQSIETQAQLLGCAIQYRLRLPNFAAIAQVVANGVGVAVMPKRAAMRLSVHYTFHQIKLNGAWANRKLLLAARSFDELPVPYQHFSQFLLAKKSQLSLG